MWNTRSSSAPQAALCPSKWWRLWCALGIAVLPAVGAAQVPDRPVTMLKSGLKSSYEGHSLLLTVSEVGPTTAVSTVTVEFRDALDQTRLVRSGSLRRTRPVRVRVPIPPGSGLDQLRVIVRITRLSGDESAPIVDLEDLDPIKLSVTPTGPGCALPPTAGAPPSHGGGAEAHCPGWNVSHLTLDEANSSPD